MQYVTSVAFQFYLPDNTAENATSTPIALMTKIDLSHQRYNCTEADYQDHLTHFSVVNICGKLSCGSRKWRQQLSLRSEYTLYILDPVLTPCPHPSRRWRGMSELRECNILTDAVPQLSVGMVGASVHLSL